MIHTKFNGYAPDGRRLYHKGGDGGAGEAKAAEADRQARITSATDRINSIFDGKSYSTGKGKVANVDPSKTYFTEDGKQWQAPVDQFSTQMLAQQQYGMLSNGLTPAGTSNPGVSNAPPVNTFNPETGTWGMESAPAPVATPTMYDKGAINKALGGGLFESMETVESPLANRQQLYDQQKSAVFDINKRDVDRQFQETERATRFGLARNGLMGGSEDVDSRARLQDINNQGLIKASGLGDAAAADLRTADERSRQSLISMAQSGVDTGTMQGMALRNLDATAQDAAGTRSGATIGNLFSDLGKSYLTNQRRAGQIAGMGNTGQQQYGSMNTSNGDSGDIYK